MELWLIYAITSMVLWGLWGFLLKIAERGSDWLTVYVFSSIAAFATALLNAMILSRTAGSKVKLDPSGGILIALIAGILGNLGYLFFMLSLTRGNAGLVVTLTGLYPIITIVLSVMLLGEQLSVMKAIGIILALIAMALLSS